MSAPDSTSPVQGAGRFRKGTSGNPAGRRLGARDRALMALDNISTEGPSEDATVDLTGTEARPHSVVVSPSGLCLELDAATGVRELWVFLSPKIGWGRFEHVTTSQGTYLLREARQERPLTPFRRVSTTQVWWSRRAALEAHQAIAAYREEEDCFPQSALG